MTKSKILSKSTKTSAPNHKKIEAAVTRSFSLPYDVDNQLEKFMQETKRSRSSVITEAITTFLSSFKEKQ